MTEKKEWKCEVCGEVFETYAALFAHIKKMHKLNRIEYYNKYLKKEGEGVCLNCGKPTKLWTISRGYYNFCSHRCDYDYRKKLPKTGEQSKHKEFIYKNGKYICKICGKHTNLLGSHVVQTHHILSKEYYDKYLKKVGEGICPICGKETRFVNLQRRYKIYCSNKCSNNSIKTINKRKHTTYLNHGDENYRNSEQARKTSAKHIADGTIKLPKEICQSQAETDIIEFIKTFYKNKIVHGERLELDGYELDIWLPDIRVGIEFDGEYWHADPRRFKPSDIIKDKTAQEIWARDKRKDLLCESKGINLLRIKEYDYNHNRDEIFTNLYKYIIKYDQKEVKYG